jgi:CheY-like chemotaxis protein
LKPKILIVDDNDLNVELTQQLLEGDYTLQTAKNGAEALKVAASFLPDLVIMDLSMPVMDGWEATRRLRAKPEHQGVRILAVSACTIPNEVERAMAVGCDGFVTKPIDDQMLLDKIRTLLEGRISAVPEGRESENPNVTPQDHRRTRLTVDSCPVGVTSYRLGDMWLSHVDTESGEVIGRARGVTREDAEKEAIAVATTKVQSSRKLRSTLDDLRASVTALEASMRDDEK